MATEHDAEGQAETTHGVQYRSVRHWLTTTDHKDIGILYTITGVFYFLLGGLLALLVRLELLTATGTGILGSTGYYQAVSGHGIAMIFFFISPIAFGMANYIVPLQIGADDLAFPRLNALAYWLYLGASVLFGLSFFQGATFSGGWTMYAPLNVPAYMPRVGASTVVLSLVLMMTSSTVSSVNFLTTFHWMRAEGMRLRDMPLFSISILLTVWMMLFAFTALLAALLLLSADRLVLSGVFAATDQGSSVLWSHLFWFFGHPEVYIVFFPALGIMGDTFQTFTGRRIVGRKWFIAALVLVALQSFVVWMHHMFLTSINLQIKTLFMATTIGISLPFDLMVFSFLYTMVKGRIRFATPFLFSFGGLLLFVVGGITGVFLGAVVLDYEFRGTYWVVAHFHYAMLGGGSALFGGLYYWYPKMTGKMYDEFLGKLHFALYFVGFNLLYFPMFVAWESPRRVFDYQPEFAIWHQLATVGAFVLGFSFLIMLYNLGKSYWTGEEAGDTPWEYASTAEWALPSPPPLENFPGVPSYRTGTLSFLDRGPAREATDGGAIATGTPEHAVVAETGDHEEGDHGSYWPVVLSLGAVLFLAGLSGVQEGSFAPGFEGTVYAAVTALGIGVGGLGVVGLGREAPHVGTTAVAERWPFDGVEKTKLGVWIYLASDVVLFGAFISAYLFTRVAEGWQAWDEALVPAEHVVLPGLLNTYILLTSSFAVVLALVAARKRSRAGLVAGLVTTLVLGVAFLVNKGIEWIHLFGLQTEAFPQGWGLGTNVAASMFYLTTGLHGLHVLVGLVMAVWLLVRASGGAYLGEGESITVEYFGLYWHFVDIVWLFLFPLFYII